MRVLYAKDEGLITICTTPSVLPDLLIKGDHIYDFGENTLPRSNSFAHGNCSSIENKPYGTLDAPSCIDYRIAMREWSRIVERRG